MILICKLKKHGAITIGMEMGLSGCDSHCIPYPCGECMRPELRPKYFQLLMEIDILKKQLKDAVANSAAVLSKSRKGN